MKGKTMACELVGKTKEKSVTFNGTYATETVDYLAKNHYLRTASYIEILL